MKPFIYNFLEQPVNHLLGDELESIEYNNFLNLSVIKGTNTPAINLVSMSTETLTKSDSEGTDSDRDFKAHKNSMQSLGTMTQTRQMIEGSDSDYNRAILQLMDTSTITLVSHEATDSDRDNPIRTMLSTRTLTETKESTDSDR